MFSNPDSPQTKCRGTINGILQHIEDLQAAEGKRNRIIEVLYRRKFIRDKLIELVNLHLRHEDSALQNAAHIGEKYMSMDTGNWMDPFPFDLRELHLELQFADALLPPNNAYLRNRIQEYFEHDSEDYGGMN